MEVHHHSHTERKKWTHYFWEFFMLFLAVTLGFLVENQREHYVEHQRERQFMKTLVRDLEMDVKGIDSILDLRSQRRSEMLNVIKRLSYPNPAGVSDSLYFNCRQLLTFAQFSTNDRTIVQLRNGANLRLIRKQTVSDSILSYYKIESTLAFYYSVENDVRGKIRDVMSKIFDGFYMDKMIPDSATSLILSFPVTKPPLFSDSPELINELKMQLHFFRSIYLATMGHLLTYRNQATQLINLIKKEYHNK